MGRDLMPDALRLALGTLTRIPVPAPRNVDRRVAGRAMLLAPLVGLLLALVIGVPAQVLVNVTPVGGLLGAALAVAALAWLTRALHLDGLADTADALGSGRAAPDALAIARQSDIGPFGVVTLVLVMLVQVAALADLLDRGAGAGGLVVAVVTGRLALTLACMRGIQAARTDGLGALVAGSVPRVGGIVLALAWQALAVASVGREHGLAAGIATGGAVLAGLLAAAAIVQLARRRLGGITGDVLGATAEIVTAVVLVILVAVP
jgi:adenosylcobinamide-GDP ribazoletransferase